MSTIQELQNRISMKVEMIAGMKAALNAHLIRTNNIIRHIEGDMAQLKAELKVAEYMPPCYYCGNEGSCSCEYDAEEENMDDGWSCPEHEREPEQSFPNRCERMKLMWVSNSNHETYRVAIVTKNGILQVKSVTDGVGDCHDTHNCSCTPCREIRLSRGRLSPWYNGLPLKKTFFPTEAAWRASLPEGGGVTSHSPVTDAQLKKLLKPLTATTDALKLKELEERFPGAKMVFATEKVMHEIEYMGNDKINQHRIFSNTTGEIRGKFSDFGPQGKPNLMAEWKGLYIGLEHLF